MLELFDMGAHTFFVWLAYGGSLLALLWLVFSSVSLRNSTKLKVLKKIERSEKLKASKTFESET